MAHTRPRALGGILRGAGLAGRHIMGVDASVSLDAIADGTCLAVDRQTLAGQSVLIATDDQMTAALALIELDGVARRMVLSPPDLRPDYLAAIVDDAEVDAIVSDRDPETFAATGKPVVGCGLPVAAYEGALSEPCATEWVLLTSGTTGIPKMVVHSLAGLTAAITTPPPRDKPTVWATFYDIRRYGGLQIFLRAMLGDSSLVLSQAGEPIVDHLHRLAASDVTHISGTPSHWRRTIMCSTANAIAPDYIRLSGEIADQTILNALHDTYPDAAIGHAYASTEAGVGFAVDDGLEGFPASLIEGGGDVSMKVEDGSLRIRSPRGADRYLGRNAEPLTDADGFIDTGDMIERRGDRFYFVGRRGGIINVGGLKVHPEEVEAVINRHQGVRMSLVKARKSPIMGSIVVAEVVLNDNQPAASGEGWDDALKDEIIHLCRGTLPQHKVPATIRFVPTLTVTAAGKLARDHA